MHKLEVKLGDRDPFMTEISGKKALFYELEAQGFVMDTGCLAGSCGLCKVEILTGIDNFNAAGVVEQGTIDAVTIDERQWRMSCCAHVTGSVSIAGNVISN